MLSKKIMTIILGALAIVLSPVLITGAFFLLFILAVNVCRAISGDDCQLCNNGNCVTLVMLGLLVLLPLGLLLVAVVRNRRRFR